MFIYMNVLYMRHWVVWDDNDWDDDDSNDNNEMMTIVMMMIEMMTMLMMIVMMIIKLCQSFCRQQCSYVYACTTIYLVQHDPSYDND